VTQAIKSKAYQFYFLRLDLLSIWKLNRKIVKLQQQRDSWIKAAQEQYGIEQFNQWYGEFEHEKKS